MTGKDISGSGVVVDPEVLIAQRDRVVHFMQKDAPMSALPGGFAISRRGNGQVIADSRIYMHGDDMRHVDRGAIARTGKLHIRTFHEERDRATFLVADFRPSMLWGMKRAFRSVAAAEALAWLGWQAVESGGRVGLLVITGNGRDVVATRPRVAGMLAVIGGMVRAHKAALEFAQTELSDPPLDEALEGLDKIVPRGAEIVIATALDNKGKRLDEVLGHLARHRSPRILVIEDRAMNELPAGCYPLADPGGSKIRAFFSRMTQTSAISLAGLEAFPVNYIDAGEKIGENIAGLGR